MNRKFTFKKINSYTRVLDDGKKTLVERQKLLDENSLSKSTNYLKEKKNRRPTDQNKLYTRFVNDAFKDRRFIGQKEFNSMIKDKFNSSTTYYRKRMVELGLIIVFNKLVRKRQNENNQTSEDTEETKNDI